MNANVGVPTSEFTRGFMCGLDSAVAAFQSAVHQSPWSETSLAIQLSALMVVAVAMVRENLLGKDNPDA